MNKIEQHLAGLTAHIFKRYPNRGQWRSQKSRKRLVIKSNHSHSIWNGYSTLVGSREQAHGRGEAATGAEVAIADECFVKRNPCRSECILVPKHPFSNPCKRQRTVCDQSNPQVS